MGNEEAAGRNKVNTVNLKVQITLHSIHIGDK